MQYSQDYSQSPLPPQPAENKKQTLPTRETGSPPASSTWHKTRKVNNDDSEKKEDKHNLLPLREVSTALRISGYVNMPIKTGDVTAFKKEMGRPMDDPLGVADRLDEFLGPSIYSYDDINAILRSLFNNEE